MSVLVFKGTEPSANADFLKMLKDKRIVSKRDRYYDAKYDAYFNIDISGEPGCDFCEGINAQTEHLKDIYKKISAYFRIDKDVMYKLSLLISMANHNDW